MEDNKNISYIVAAGFFGLLTTLIKLLIDSYIVYYLYEIIVHNVFTEKMREYISGEITYTTALAIVVLAGVFNSLINVKWEDKK